MATQSETVLNQIGEWFGDFYSDLTTPIKTEIVTKWTQWKSDQAIAFDKWKGDTTKQALLMAKTNWKPLTTAGFIFLIPILIAKLI